MIWSLYHTALTAANQVPRAVMAPSETSIPDHDLSTLSSRGFQIEFHSHSKAILFQDFPDALAELQEVLSGATIPITEIIGSGGGESKGTQRLRRALAAKNWTKINFRIEKTINGVTRESISHEVDHVRTCSAGLLALEIEWNNKDPFFDRDLENFKRLRAEGAISVGIIVTRGETLQNEMRELVRRFSVKRKLATFTDLNTLGLTPTPRQRAAIESSVGRARDPMTFGDGLQAAKRSASALHNACASSALLQ